MFNGEKRRSFTEIVGSFDRLTEILEFERFTLGCKARSFAKAFRQSASERGPFCMKIMTMCKSMGHKRFKCPHEFTKHDRTLQKKSLAHNFERNTEYSQYRIHFIQVSGPIRTISDYQALSVSRTCVRTVWAAVLFS